MKNRCCSRTIKGRICKNNGLINQKYCNVHSSKINCTICFDPINSLKKLSCNHVFCKDCIFKWINVSPFCPCCRRQVSPYDYNQAINYNIVNGNLIIKCTHSYHTIITADNYHFYEYLTDSDALFHSLNFDTMAQLKQDMHLYENIWNQFLNMDRMTNIKIINLDEYHDYYSDFEISTDYQGIKYLDIYKFKVN